MSCSRGFRNNNPGNIEIGDKWQGLSMGNDSRFCTFRSMAFGYRAMFKILISYSKRGIHTIDQIISTWAPKCENNTRAYVRMVCRTTGYESTKIIDINNEVEMIKIVSAMSKVENGNSFDVVLQLDYIKEAWAMLHKK